MSKLTNIDSFRSSRTTRITFSITSIKSMKNNSWVEHTTNFHCIISGRRYVVIWYLSNNPGSRNQSVCIDSARKAQLDSSQACSTEICQGINYKHYKVIFKCNN